MWLDIVPGVPGWSGDRFVRAADLDGWRRLVVDDEPVTPVGLQVRAVLAIDDDGVLFTGSEEPTEMQVWSWRPGSGLEQLTSARGMHGAARGGGTLVLSRADLDHFGARVEVHRADLRGRHDRVARRDTVAHAAGLPAHGGRSLAARRAPASDELRRRRRAAPGAHAPVRRPTRSDGGGPARSVPRRPVDRRPRVRRRGDRRSRDAGSWDGLGTGDLRRHRDDCARGPGRRPAWSCEGTSRARPRSRRDHRLVVRRLPRRPRGPSSAGRLPRRRGGRAVRSTGGSTTRTTPSATSVTRTSIPTSTTGSHCSTRLACSSARS